LPIPSFFKGTTDILNEADKVCSTKNWSQSTIILKINENSIWQPSKSMDTHTPKFLLERIKAVKRKCLTKLYLNIL
jgi:hypothetical protein